MASLAGVLVPRGTREREFADAVADSERPLIIDFERRTGRVLSSLSLARARTLASTTRDAPSALSQSRLVCVCVKVDFRRAWCWVPLPGRCQCASRDLREREREKRRARRQRAGGCRRVYAESLLVGLGQRALLLGLRERARRREAARGARRRRLGLGASSRRRVLFRFPRITETRSSLERRRRSREGPPLERDWEGFFSRRFFKGDSWSRPPPRAKVSTRERENRADARRESLGLFFLFSLEHSCFRVKCETQTRQCVFFPPAEMEKKSSVAQETAKHPVPPYGVFSPVVQHVLQQWSSDAKKLQYVRLWLTVATDADGAVLRRLFQDSSRRTN